jgi:hypothetical protein
MMSKILIVILAGLLSSACSNKAIYETLNSEERRKCYELLGAAFDECIQRTAKTYDEYEQERSDEFDNPTSDQKSDEH